MLVLFAQISEFQIARDVIQQKGVDKNGRYHCLWLGY